jgi:hypothetical protein
MDSLKILFILFAGVTFNLSLVLFVVFWVRSAKAKQKEEAMIKRKQLLEQGKIITAQEKLLKSKQELLKEKELLLDIYRKTME